MKIVKIALVAEGFPIERIGYIDNQTQIWNMLRPVTNFWQMFTRTYKEGRDENS